MATIIALKEDFTFDAELVMEDSLDAAGAVSAIVASQAGTLLDVAKVLDVGDGIVEGYMIIDIDAIDVTVAADLLYKIKLQGSNVAAFATAALIQDLAQIELGAGEMLFGGTAITSDRGLAGERYVVPFRNEKGGTVFRYLRVYTYQEGTGDTITHTTWLTITRRKGK